MVGGVDRDAAVWHLIYSLLRDFFASQTTSPAVVTECRCDCIGNLTSAGSDCVPVERLLREQLSARTACAVEAGSQYLLWILGLVLVGLVGCCFGSACGFAAGRPYCRAGLVSSREVIRQAAPQAQPPTAAANPGDDTPVLDVTTLGQPLVPVTPSTRRRDAGA